MDKELQHKGNTLTYRVTGSGEPLILMHGWGCNRDTVASIEQVAAESHTVYNVDFPGFGKSPEPDDVWGVEEYTRMIEELARKEKLESPVLAGHSFGGRVGLLMASRNPVKKLILVDAAGIKPRRPLKYYLKVYSFKTSRKLLTLLMGKERGMKVVEKLRGKSGSADYNSASPQMRRILSKVVNEDLRHVMPSIKAPTLLIWGENDTATPLSDARTMERLIPDAGLVSFAGCGHYSFLDNRAQFAAVLRSFLNS